MILSIISKIPSNSYRFLVGVMLGTPLQGVWGVQQMKNSTPDAPRIAGGLGSAGPQDVGGLWRAVPMDLIMGALRASRVVQ